MNPSAAIERTFLQDATPQQLEKAVALNHQELFDWNARVSGGEVHRSDRMTWIYSPEGKGGGVITFPELDESTASERIDEVIAFYLERRPESLVGCWSLDPTQPRDLGVRLLARGFQPGWRPNWMALDLERIETDHPRPEGLEVRLDQDMAVKGVPDLPYSGGEGWSAADDESRGRAWHYVAYLEGKPVGHCAVFLTFGPLGVGGIYNMGVLPDARNKGIGKAVLLACCLRAKEEGCRYAMLNGTGQRMYEQVGFRKLGDGWTWWLNVPRLAKNPPSPGQVTLAEAVGRGDLDALRGLEGRVGPEEVNTPMTNEMTLLELTADQGKPESGEWLVEHGAEPDLLTFWDFGWKERVERLLSEDTGRVNRRSGDWGRTPMHSAVERNDLDLARLLLRFGPDLDLEDTAYHSTPLGWAEHLGRTEFIEMIHSHQGVKNG